MATTKEMLEMMASQIAALNEQRAADAAKIAELEANASKQFVDHGCVLLCSAEAENDMTAFLRCPRCEQRSKYNLKSTGADGTERGKNGNIKPIYNCRSAFPDEGKPTKQ